MVLWYYLPRSIQIFNCRTWYTKILFFENNCLILIHLAGESKYWEFKWYIEYRVKWNENNWNMHRRDRRNSTHTSMQYLFESTEGKFRHIDSFILRQMQKIQFEKERERNTLHLDCFETWWEEFIVIERNCPNRLFSF